MSQCILDHIHNLIIIYRIHLFWDTFHIFHVFFVRCVGIIQSVSGSYFCGCELNGGHTWGLFLCRPLPFIYLLEGRVGEPEG